jgi:amidase
MANSRVAVGLTSRHMVIPFSEHEDTVGPLARTVKDAAYILQAIAGVDPLDNYTSAIPGGVIPDYIFPCKLSGLSGTRLGIPRNVISMLSDNSSKPMLEAFERSLDILRSAGATIVEDTNFTAAAEYMNSTAASTVVFADWKTNLPNYLESLVSNPHNINTFEDVRDFTTTSPLEDFPERDVGLFDLALQSAPADNISPLFWAAYQQALYFGNKGGLVGAIERHHLDAVILPANFAPHWAAPIGAPIVTVPMGAYPAGIPVMKDSWGLVEVAPNIP